MTSSSAAALPLSPLDPERGALLHRVVEGLEPAWLHWLSDERRYLRDVY